MIHLAYDEIAYSGDRTQLRVRPNCPEPAGRFGVSTLLPLALMPGLTCERTDALLRTGHPFVYPLEFGWDWSQRLAPPSGDMAPGFPVAVLESIRAGRASLLITSVEAIHLRPDPHSPLWLFDHVLRFIRDNDLPPERVWFVSGRVTALEDFVVWLQQRQLYEREVFRFRALLVWAAFVRGNYRANAEGWEIDYAADPDQTVTVTRRPFAAAAFADRYVDPGELETERASGALRPKRFLAMNHRRWPHRVHIAAYLQGRGYLDGSLVSFPETAVDQYDVYPAPVLDEFLRASWLALHPKLPLTIDIAQSASAPSTDVQSRLEHGWPYRQSYFNLTAETSMYPPPFYTEKVLKAIVNLQPFLLIGPPDTVRYLRANGFKSFGRLIDERYDLPGDLATRLSRAFGAIDQIGQLAPAAARDLYFECLPELLHNRTHLIDGRHQLDELWAEIATQLP